ncbi:MAG: hypothetical protein EON59_06800 [Alphaproteobacteria bacterium]|nr:MAG: hypothetical protein EON59_06800 [Alphaproteobacteria bacterium]
MTPDLSDTRLAEVTPPQTPELVELKAVADGDHDRGCQGREYVCSCGYDDRLAAAAEQAAQAIERLEAERDELQRQVSDVDALRVAIFNALLNAGGMVAPGDEPDAVQRLSSRATTAEASLALAREARREDIAWTVMLLDLEEDGDWPDEKVTQALSSASDKHSGDCRKEPWTCMRCRADRAYEIADRVIRARSTLQMIDRGGADV